MLTQMQAEHRKSSIQSSRYVVKNDWRQTVEDTLNSLLLYFEQLSTFTPDQKLKERFQQVINLLAARSYKQVNDQLSSLLQGKNLKKFLIANTDMKAIKLRKAIFTVESIESLDFASDEYAVSVSKTVEPSSFYYKCLAEKCQGLRQLFYQLSSLISSNGIVL